MASYLIQIIFRAGDKATKIPKVRQILIRFQNNLLNLALTDKPCNSSEQILDGQVSPKSFENILLFRDSDLGSWFEQDGLDDRLWIVVSLKKYFGIDS